MSPLIQPIVDMISQAAAVVFLSLGFITTAAVLVRQLKWFGFNRNNSETLKQD
jgi:hypothetical protein